MPRRKFDIMETQHAAQAHAQLRAQELQREGVLVDDKPPPKKSNRGNVRCRDESGEWFDSKLELACYREAVRRCAAVIRQVSIPIGLMENGKSRRMRPDFLEIHEIRDDGTFVGKFVDAKGREERDWTLKAEMFRAKYNDLRICRRKEI